MRVYLDNAATTRLDELVLEEMRKHLAAGLGNASALHPAGVEAAKVIERARITVAQSIRCRPDEIVFTSGGTESNNLAVKGSVDRGGHLIISSIEHPSVSAAASWLAGRGVEVTRLRVDGEGFVDPDEVRRSLRPKTRLVSVVHASNEVGTLQPLAEIGAVCREAGVPFHTDACQSYTRVGIDVERDGIDLLTVNAHKIHGPTGVGALYVREGVAPEPLFHGGDQERGLRSGTLNTAGIAGLAAAVEVSDEGDAVRMADLRDRFVAAVTERLQGVRLNGPRGEGRLCNNVSVCFDGVRGKDLFLALVRRGIAISTGSACASTKPVPSAVLLAMGLSAKTADTAVRISLSKWTTWAELQEALAAITEVVSGLREGDGR